MGLYLMALGTGGINPCVSSFGADQFDDSDEAEKNNQEFLLQLVSISQLTLVHLWLLLCLFGYKQTLGGAGLRHPSRGYGTCCCELLFRHSVVQKPDSRWESPHSHLPGACCILQELYETADEEPAVKGIRKLDHTKQLSFLDKAALET
ncbi:hypothetical protein PS2_032623 [Malus domestica]